MVVRNEKKLIWLGYQVEVEKVYPFNLTYIASEIADDELITITITKTEK